MSTSGELNVDLPGNRMLIPDFTVPRRSDLDGLTVAASDVVLVGEANAPKYPGEGQGALKHQLCAEAGIPFYLLVDPKGTVSRAISFELVDAEYKEIVRSGTGKIEFAQPFMAALHLAG